MRRIPLKTADEQDALTSWRRFYVYLQRPGAADKIKRRYRRRERRLAKKEIRNEA
jgi:hypothetical protein